MSLLSIKNLQIGISDDPEAKKIVKGFNLEIKAHKIVALVGGSGGGKTLAGLSILQLLPQGVCLEGGEILFKDQDILKYSPERMQRIRGRKISMVFQEPLSAFNPVFSIGFQIEEVLKTHLNLRRRQRKERVWELLDTVGLPDPKRVARYYPHELSGGMRQRAMIAVAIAADPKIIIADEPTSNLDVTLQAHIIELFRKLKSELKISILLITHDLGVVKQLADQVGVLYNGQIVEFKEKEDIFSAPHHPYTRELLEAIAL